MSNLQVAAWVEKGSPVTASGVPENYPDAKELVTEDCFRLLLPTSFGCGPTV